MKRKDQMNALKNLIELNDVNQQYKIIDIMLKGLFKVSVGQGTRLGCPWWHWGGRAGGEVTAGGRQSGWEQKGGRSRAPLGVQGLGGGRQGREECDGAVTGGSCRCWRTRGQCS